MKICKKNKQIIIIIIKKKACVKRQKMLSIASNKVWGDNMKEEKI